MVLSMDRWVGKVAVVTGVSSGIGLSIAERLVEEGVKVAALARRKDKLDALAKKLEGKKGKLFPIQTDLTKEEEILNAFKWTKQNLGPIHVLINNAGAATKGLLSDGDTESWTMVFKLNVIGLCIATREAIKDMKANNVDGHIIHINSVAGYRVLGPDFNVYPPSKFAVRALAETLRLELNSQKSKIKITNLSPGLVDTEAARKLLQNLDIETLKKEGKILEPENIADAAIYVLSTPPHVQIQELIIRPVLNAY